MSEITPEPWEISPIVRTYILAPVRFEALSIGGGPEQKQVALIPLDESNQANARLIQVAPKLLALCERLVEEIGSGSDLDWHLRNEGYADNLQALVAKARESSYER